MPGRLCWQGIRDVLRQPWSCLGTVAAVAVTVYLGGIFALALQALDTEFLSDRGRIQFQVYWRVGADPELVGRQWDWMRALPYLSDLRTFTPGQALEVMRQSLNPKTDLGWLRGKNPLPYTALLAFRLSPADPDFAKAMGAHCRQAGVQAFGRPGEMLFLGHGHEGSQVVVFHNAPPGVVAPSGFRKTRFRNRDWIPFRPARYIPSVAQRGLWHTAGAA